jgi:8-oxo-dGTP pyrophosphatase MutT (NUDIX family)
MAMAESPTMTAATLREALRLELAGPVPTVEGAPPADAAVAAVLRDDDPAALLFIKRAERHGDPWSGDIGLPGGHVEAGDADALATAVRETGEEIGLDLQRDGELLGRLPVARTHLVVGRGPRWVAPFVFAVRGASPLTLSDEVQEVVWVPISYLLDPENRGDMMWGGRGVPMLLHCYRFKGHLIWGLTLKIVDELLGRIPERP